ncbi:MAG: hypothetical protein JF887_02590 [Candidatus Dormibacteraeota bacterium]|uniref:Uncharacterized protein n=1 Tax=Candidatus Amunia macphersoniae TaxID=3127014 RepID=A0A934KIB4_9BACT|nr:hypothetical protein [Candidatus Dormibacteraeota bacterium]
MAAQMAPPMDGDLIARAGREIWDRRITSVRRRIDGSRIRQRVAAIDSLIGILEERHLTGERSFDRVLRQRLYNLEHEVGLPLPRKAVRARNTVRLHAALLDWQETILDALMPERLRFPDVHDNDWATPTPLGW